MNHGRTRRRGSQPLDGRALRVSQFLITAVLTEALGVDWLKDEARVPEGRRHPVATWLLRFHRMLTGPRPPGARDEGNGIVSVEPDGSLQALLCLAYDMYLLLHGSALPDRLLRRLRHRDQFQGTAYEIHIAAVFARLGHAIEWMSSASKRHHEFTARNKATGLAVAVETKSRHRQGVLGFQAGVSAATDVRTHATRQLAEAILQAPGDMPSLCSWTSTCPRPLKESPQP